MADMHAISGGQGAQIRAELHELGGLGEDDSLRVAIAADALRAISALLDGHETLTIRGPDMAALLHLVANDVQRVNLRQTLDSLRGPPRRA